MALFAETIFVQQFLGWAYIYAKMIIAQLMMRREKSFVSLLLISAACPPCSDDHIGQILSGQDQDKMVSTEMIRSSFEEASSGSPHQS